MAGSNSCYSCISKISKFHYMMVLPLQMYLSQPRCMASYSCLKTLGWDLLYFECKTHTVYLGAVTR